VTRRSWQWLILLCVVQMAVSAAMLETIGKARGWGLFRGEDSEGYELVARWATGEVVSDADQPALRYRLFNPVLPVLAGWWGQMVGLEWAFLTINVAAWILGTLAVRRFVAALWGDEVGFVAAALYATSLPLIEWGLPMMLDAAAFAFTAAFLAEWVRRPDATVRFGVLLALGVLLKPPLLCLVLFAGLSCALDRQWRRGVLIGGLATLLVLGAYAALGLTWQDFVRFGEPRHRGMAYLATAGFFAFHGLALAALMQISREPSARRRVWVTYLMASLATFLPFVHSPRLAFQTFAAVLPLAAAWIVRRTARTRWLVSAIATSNLLALAHLLVMRRLEIRDLGALWERLR
jgi:4-amino-4-deoxy-L-arabinose transferase-like glycosyltransferase